MDTNIQDPNGVQNSVQKPKKRRGNISLKGTYRTKNDRVVCKMCMKAISKRGNLYHHFDKHHDRCKPILLQQSEGHLYDRDEDDQTCAITASKYADATHNTGYISGGDLSDESEDQTPPITEKSQAIVGQKRKATYSVATLQSSLC